MLGVLDIQLGEVLGSSKSVQCLINERQRVSIFLDNFVEPLIIAAKPELAIFLLDKDDLVEPVVT